MRNLRFSIFEVWYISGMDGHGMNGHGMDTRGMDGRGADFRAKVALFLGKSHKNQKTPQSHIRHGAEGAAIVANTGKACLKLGREK